MATPSRAASVTNASNNAWTVETPREKAAGTNRPDKLNKNYEATLGGPILRDRLWFFTAGRWQDNGSSETLPETNLPFNTTTKNTRFEGKGTATITNGHRVQVNYIRDTTDQTRLPFAASIDPNVAEHPHFPNRLFVASYNGVLSSKLLANFQVSQKKEAFQGSGGTDPDIHASPFFTVGVAEGVPGSLHYNGNYFDATDPEDRDNFQYAGSLVLLPDEVARWFPRHQGRDRALHVEPDRRQFAERQRLRVRYRLRARGERPRARCQRPDHPDVCAGRDAARKLAGDARRQSRHPHAVVLPAGQLDARAQADAESRRPSRTGEERGHGRNHRRRYEHHGAAARRHLRSVRQRPDRSCRPRTRATPANTTRRKSA